MLSGAQFGELTQRQAVLHVARFVDMAPERVKAEGRAWWPSAHQLAVRGGRELGVGTKAASGVIAAVSPGMEWGQNAKVLSQVQGLGESEWGLVRASRQQPHQGKGTPPRLPETKAMLAERAPALAGATDEQLLKVHRMMHGEDPEEVLHRQTAPKTNSMFWNLYHPGKTEKVTVDGRIYDVVTNRMKAWNEHSIVGTRYEQTAQVIRDAASILGQRPDVTQATAWVHAKHIELSGLTKAGQPRKQGPRRQGQPYVTR